MHEEAVAQHVEHIEIDLQLLPPDFVELRVNEYPALFGSIPVFADLMILEVTGVQIGAESATRPGRDSLSAQHIGAPVLTHSRPTPAITRAHIQLS